MRECKNNKNIWITIVLIGLVICFGGFIIYDKLININEKSENKDNNEDSILVYDYNLEKNKCVKTNNINFEDSYKINVNGKDFKYTYFKNINNDSNFIEEKFDDKLIKTKKPTEDILYEVCNYDNYLLTAENWEGLSLVKLISSSGNIVFEDRAVFEYQNGILKLHVIDGTYTDDEYLYQRVNLDLTKKDIEKEVIKKEIFSCANIEMKDFSEDVNVFDEEYVKQIFCYGP